MRTSSVVAVASIVLAVPAFAQGTPDENSLREADALQNRIISEQDAKAQRDFMHPNYMVNAPSNRVMRKEQMVAMLAEGKLASESFVRTVEGTSITGNVGIVMGREIVTPTVDSQLGKQFGHKPLARRFTNVFIWEAGKWRFLARQATVIAAP